MNAMTGCTETTDGFHQIDWMDVPAQTWNAGSSDEFEAYGAHQRGQCQACEQTFSREKPAEFLTDLLRETRRANARAHAERDHVAGNFRADAREVAELTTSADTREYWTFYAERIDQLERIAARETSAVVEVRADRDAIARASIQLRSERDLAQEQAAAAHTLIGEAVLALNTLRRTIQRDKMHTLDTRARLASQVSTILDILTGEGDSDGDNESDELTSEQQAYADIMFYAYRRSLLWQSPNSAHFDDPDAPEMLDQEYSVDDFSDEANASMRADVEDFVRGAWADLTSECMRYVSQYTADQAGHDFALTRNHHGAGFWDRGLGEVGDRLTAMAEPYGESSAYVGDDGALHV